MFIIVALLLSLGIAAGAHIDLEARPKHSIPGGGNRTEALTSRLHGPGRIVGGHATAPGEFPYLVYIYTDLSMVFGVVGLSCGGSIISDRWVLTAAHCFPLGMPLSVMLMSITVTAGDFSRSDTSGHEQKRTPTQVIIHPGYNSNTHANDIALVEVPPLMLNPLVQPIALPSQGSFPTCEYYDVCGWGHTTSGGSPSDTIRAVSVPAVSNTACNEAYKSNPPILDSMVCAGEAGKDSCQGDSGGPLSCGQNPRIQVGVVSFGTGCGKPGIPGVYTEVATYTDWIWALTGV